MNNLEAIEAHQAQVGKRTTMSVICFFAFAGAGIASGLQNRPLEHPLTLAALGLVVASFWFLPRDYIPALLQHRAKTEDEELALDDLRQKQKQGLVLRLSYSVMAILVIFLPQLLSAGQA
jgi:hypothetical protein